MADATIALVGTGVLSGTNGMSRFPSYLLVFPCAASKHGTELAREVRSIPVADLIGPEARRLLKEGRSLAFRRQGTRHDDRSSLVPALALYTGNPYKVSGFRDAIRRLLAAGGHCLILSGGYGLLRPEERVHNYDAHLPRTALVWRQRIPVILDDYIRRNGIKHVFIACSQGYRKVLGDQWTLTAREVYWCIPKAGRGEAAVRVVPEKLGTAIVRLVNGRMLPDWRWTRRSVGRRD